MKRIAFLILFVLLCGADVHCQSIKNVSETIPIVYVKYPPLAEILTEVLHEEESEDYFSDTLNFIMTYGCSSLEVDSYWDTAQLIIIDSATLLYTFNLSPCPVGIPTIDDSLFYLVRHSGHYFYLVHYTLRQCDNILFTYSNESIQRNSVVLTEAMEDDRWPEYYYMSATDSKGEFRWRRTGKWRRNK